MTIETLLRELEELRAISERDPDSWSKRNAILTKREYFWSSMDVYFPEIAAAMRDSMFCVRLIELIKAMDLQATRRYEQGGDEDVVVEYTFKTGLWHRILGMIAGHDAAAWLRTEEGQRRVSEASERANATIEELERAQAIDWSKYRAARAKEEE